MASLADGAKHGYAITRDVEEIAGVTLGPGTLYGALARLEERGLIEPLPSDGPAPSLPADGSGRRRPARAADGAGARRPRSACAGSRRAGRFA